MTALTIPVIPPLPAGYVVDDDDLNALCAAAAFLLGKPMTRIHDTAGGQAIGTSPGNVQFSVADFDVDGMWAGAHPQRLTCQTPGWYACRYMVNCAAGGCFVTWVTITTGPSNPAGSGVTSAPYWSGYCNGVSTGQASRASGGGVLPLYLYSGDYVQVAVQAAATGNSTGTGAAGSATVGGSFLSLEYVST